MIVQTEGLYFSYGGADVLKGVSVQCGEGKFTSVIGTNGSGKTTLLKIIAGLLKPRSGSVKVCGKDVQNYNSRQLASKISVVHQTNAYYFDFSLEDYVEMGRYAHLKRLQAISKEDREIVKNALKKTGIYDLKSKPISQLSGGERQRASIARALAQGAKIMLLDEPISNLDLRYQIEVLNIVSHLSKTEGLSVICTLHDINLASLYSDKIIALANGVAALSGSASDIVTKENIFKIYGVDAKVTENDGRPHILVGRGI